MAPPRETILVVDDEPRNRSLIAAYLGATYCIVEAEDGAAALEAVAAGPVDLVLLDVMMPGMSGFEACRALKAATAGTFLPVLLVTALSAQEDRNQGLAAGADDFLSKPVDRTELGLRCAAFLRLRRQEADIRAKVCELEELGALKDDLFGLIVHDLRNPLTGIDGYLQLLVESALRSGDAQLRADLDRAHQSARKLRSLVDGILDVRLLEEGELRLELEEVDAAALVADAIATLAGAGEAMRVPIRAEVPAGLRGRADAKLVRRALENLIANALKYSPRRSEIEVSAGLAGGVLSLDVADRGPGIPAALKGHMFEKFGSIEARRGEARRGYGLGLHLVKLVAAAHGGTASVLDREGGGSIFRLALPTAGPPR